VKGSQTLDNLFNKTHSSPVDVMDNQGTQGYTAPEVILNGKASQASDQFSLGFEFGCSKSYKNSLSTSYLDAISK
jgi:serine/threonine protein kinase